jgi:hypothetical protein
MMRTMRTSPATFAVLALILSPSMAAAQAAAGAPAATGQACVAILLPSVQGAEGDSTAFAESVRELLASYLTGPTLRSIPLEARLASQAIEEARRKECDHVLVTAISRKHSDGNGWGKALGRAAGSAAYAGVPYGAAGTAATAAARGAAVAGAQAIGSLAETTKAKDELTLEYRIGTLDDALRAAPRTGKAKAKSDHEDLLTPLAQEAAEWVAATVLKK